MTSSVFYGLATHRQAISILAWVKASFIDVQAKASWMWSENIFSPLRSLLGWSEAQVIGVYRRMLPNDQRMC